MPISGSDRPGDTGDVTGIWAALLADRPDLLQARPDPRFDAGFYHAAYPEVRAAEMDAEEHFRRHGEAEGRYPNRYRRLRHLRPGLDAMIGELVEDPGLARAVAEGREGAAELVFEAIALGDGIDARLSGFDAEHYNRLYPEVAEAGIPAIEHYVLHGHGENRRTLGHARRDLHQGLRAADPALPVCMIAVHDMSLSGAPIVGLDLAEAAAAGHNVIVVALRGGPLLERFRRQAVAVFVTDRLHEEFDLALSRLPGPPDFAVLNSVETFPFVAALVARDIPFAAYLHEYPEYTRPAYKAQGMTLFADLLVYSSHTVRAAWAPLHLDAGFDIAGDSLVLPQRALRTGRPDEAARAAARKRVAAAIGRDLGDARLVIGAGHAHWRKGTDLFVMAAQMCRGRDPETVFVWIGDGLNHEDAGFGVWLDKHMTAASAGDPEGDLFFLPAGEIYGELMRGADMLFLPSRLDPLPNVVFDAAAAGARTVLFSGATGFDDALYAGHPALVAVDYGDLGAACRAILAPAAPLAADEPSRQDAPRPAIFAAIADALRARKAPGRADAGEDGGYDLSRLFRAGPREAASRRRERRKTWRLKRRFVWRSRAEAEAALAASDNWLHRSIRIAGHAPLAAETAPEFALHLHAYFIDDLDREIGRRAAFARARRIVVTTDTGTKARRIEAIMRARGLRAEVLCVPNRGRDILPFLQLFAPGGPGGEHAIWAHVHQKRSAGWGRAGAVWRDFLMTILLGDDRTLSSALDEIARAGAGLVAPFDPMIGGWGGARRLLGSVAPGLPGDLPENPLLFPAGNMFWVRRGVAETMAGLFGPDYPWPNEPIADDGTVYHLIERLWPAVAATAGLGSVFVDKPGLRRF